MSEEEVEVVSEEDSQEEEYDFINWNQVTAQALEHEEDPDSHRELNPEIFHPSYIGCCRRQGFLRKLGLSDPDTKGLGIFQSGTLIHEWFENEVVEFLPDRVDMERTLKPYTVRVGEEEVKIVGQADAVDPKHNAVYDFKSRGGWYHFDDYAQKNLDQLLLYMKGFEDEIGGDWKGRLIYVNKKNVFDQKPFPENPDEFFELSEHQDRFEELMKKAVDIKQASEKYVRKTEKVDQYGNPVYELDWDYLLEHGVPFEKCGECYSCKKVERVVPKLRNGGVYQ